jgi:hypothetical protein
MEDVHFRLPPQPIKLAGTAVELGIFTSRSGALRSAVDYAILGNTPVQAIYDGLMQFRSLLEEFEGQSKDFLQKSMDGDTTPLREYYQRVQVLLGIFPPFWYDHLIEILRRVPEFRVIEQCLELGDEV